MKYISFIKQSAVTLMVAMLLSVLILPPASSAQAAERVVTKKTGIPIGIPLDMDGGTLKITGDALEADDWAALRDAPCVYKLALFGDTAEIPDDAFSYVTEGAHCESVASLYAPSVRSVGKRAFYRADVREISLPAAVKIDERAFAWCDELTKVSLPKAVNIGGGAFEGCLKLVSVSLPKVSDIGDNAFSSCLGLTSASCPAAVRIGEWAFAACEALAELSLPKAVDIGTAAFASCASLTGVTLPAAARIGGEAFFACDSLVSVKLPAAVRIGKRAFIKCKSLVDISLPRAVDIGDDAFCSCVSLASVSLPAATCVGIFAFFECDSLAKVSLPNAQSIGQKAFGTNDSKDVALLLELGARPKVDPFAFLGRNSPVTLAVPKDKLSGYGDALSAIYLPEGSKVMAR